MKYILSYDVETTGPRIGINNLLAVGLAVAKFDKNGYEFVDSIEVHIENEALIFDKGTCEFWGKNKEAFDKLTQGAIDKHICADMLIDFIKKYQQLAFDKQCEFLFLTDNCWFDNLWINWFLCVYGTDGYPLRYNYINVNEFNEPKYMALDKCIDLNQRVQAIKGDINQIEFNIKVPIEEHVSHDHTPVNDAKGIIQKYWQYMLSSKPYRKRVK